MRTTLRWLKARAENVAAALLAAMFIAFLLQIASRAEFLPPMGWTLELCLTTWLWAVFWGGAFLLEDKDHVKFDVLYLAVSRPTQRLFALVTSLALGAGFLAALPATIDYITFYKIKSSATMGIRLDFVFSVYGIFAVAMVVRYGLIAWQLARGAHPDDLNSGSQQEINQADPRS